MDEKAALVCFEIAYRWRDLSRRTEMTANEVGLNRYNIQNIRSHLKTRTRMSSTIGQNSTVRHLKT